ncbi:MAG: sulfurtransferase [Gammaproteobacteria bacterium]
MSALIIEPTELETLLQQEHVVVIDLSAAATYVQYHIPGAVFLNYEWILHSEPPRMGLLPGRTQLEQVFGAMGISPDTRVIAYDDEGGGRASRFLWTLECAGHQDFSLLNGGLQSWSHEGHKVSSEIHWPVPARFSYQANTDPIAERQYILDHLNHEDVVIFDARSPQEYSGAKAFAQRGGHIPGAVNIEWTETLDKAHHMRLKGDAELRDLLAAKGVLPHKEIITHCQTHHRSAHSYIVLKHLGYTRVKGYPGSWSDWGNAPNTPIEN